MLKKLYRFYPIILLGVLLIMASHVFISHAQSPVSTHVDSPPVTLTESWQYRWGDSPLNEAGVPIWVYDDFASSAWQPLKMTGTPLVAQENTLWLHIKLPEGNWRYPSLRVKEVAEIFEVYLEDELIYRAGNFNPPEKNKFQWSFLHIIPLPTDFYGKTLSFRIYSNDSSAIGLRSHVMLGSKADHIKSIVKTEIAQFIIGWVFIIAGLLGLVSILWHQRKEAYLPFSLFALSMGMWMITTPQILYLFFESKILWWYIINIALYIAAISLGVFIEHILEPAYQLIIRRLWQMELLYVIGASILAMLNIVPFVKTANIFQSLLLLIGAGYIGIVIVDAVKGNIEAWILTAGLVGFIGSGVVDALVYSGTIAIINWSPLFVGLFWLILTLGIVLGWRVRKIYLERDTNAKDLEVKNIELEAKNIELKESIKTKEKLTKVETELDIAKQVQKGILQDPSPHWSELDVVCYSSPARQIGGDWYYYHSFAHPTAKLDKPITGVNIVQQKGKYGLAVGDVSGKGPSAALLMAASLVSFQLVMEQSLSPSDLLTYLDQAITPYTKKTDSYCALCYIELDLKNHSLKVANSGCISPYIKRKNGAVDSEMVMGRPLGMDLQYEHSYKEKNFSISTGDLIILTSDGVIEAKNTKGEIFNYEGLEETISTGPSDSAQAMLDHIRKRVAEFTDNNKEQDDDLTIMVVKI